MSRNSFVGIENRRFGRLVAGNNDSAYRRLIGSGGDMGGNLGLTVVGVDLWNNTSAQLSGNGSNSVFGRGEERYHNSLHYVSPAWGLPRNSTIQVAASAGFDQALALRTTRDRFSAAALYRHGSLMFGATFDLQANTGVNADTLKQGAGLHTEAVNGASTYFYELAASYRFRFGTYIGAGFERSNYGFALLVPPSTTSFYPTLNTGWMRQNGGMASVAQAIGKATLMGSAGLLWNLSDPMYGSSADYRAMQYSLGVKYAVNDHFGAYAYATAVQNGAQQIVNLGAPLYSNNLGTLDAALAPGNKPRAAGLGALVRF